MDKRKNILIVDLRNVEDNYLIEFLNDLGCDTIPWVWLDNVIKEYECPKIRHLHGCNCCDGVSEFNNKLKKILDKARGDFS